ncbi:MAG: hypothetical protein AB1439_12815, partial [candidate division FCPU426 bacterium]
RQVEEDLVNPYFALIRNRKTPLEKLLAENQNILALAPNFPQVTESEAILTPADISQQPENVRVFLDLLRLALQETAITRLLKDGTTGLEALQVSSAEELAGYPYLNQLAVDWARAVGRDGAYIIPFKNISVAVVIQPKGAMPVRTALFPSLESESLPFEVEVVGTKEAEEIQEQILSAGGALRGNEVRTALLSEPLSPMAIMTSIGLVMLGAQATGYGLNRKRLQYLTGLRTYIRAQWTDRERLKIIGADFLRLGLALLAFVLPVITYLAAGIKYHIFAMDFLKTLPGLGEFIAGMQMLLQGESSNFWVNVLFQYHFTDIIIIPSTLAAFYQLVVSFPARIRTWANTLSVREKTMNALFGTLSVFGAFSLGIMLLLTVLTNHPMVLGAILSGYLASFILRHMKREETAAAPSSEAATYRAGVQRALRGLTVFLMIAYSLNELLEGRLNLFSGTSDPVDLFFIFVTGLLSYQVFRGLAFFTPFGRGQETLPAVFARQQTPDGQTRISLAYLLYLQAFRRQWTSRFSGMMNINIFKDNRLSERYGEVGRRFGSVLIEINNQPISDETWQLLLENESVLLEASRRLGTTEWEEIPEGQEGNAALRDALHEIIRKAEQQPLGVAQGSSGETAEMAGISRRPVAPEVRAGPWGLGNLRRGMQTIFNFMRARFTGILPDSVRPVHRVALAFIHARQAEGKIPMQSEVALWLQARGFSASEIDAYFAYRVQSGLNQAGVSVHPFRAAQGYRAAAITAVLSLALVGASFVFQYAIPDLTFALEIIGIAGVAAGGYLSIAALNYWKLARAVRDAMLASRLEEIWQTERHTPHPDFLTLRADRKAYRLWLNGIPSQRFRELKRQAKTQAIALSDGWVDADAMRILEGEQPYYAQQVRRHERYRNEFAAMLALLPTFNLLRAWLRTWGQARKQVTTPSQGARLAFSLVMTVLSMITFLAAFGVWTYFLVYNTVQNLRRERDQTAFRQPTNVLAPVLEKTSDIIPLLGAYYPVGATMRMQGDNFIITADPNHQQTFGSVILNNNRSITVDFNQKDVLVDLDVVSTTHDWFFIVYNAEFPDGYLKLQPDTRYTGQLRFRLSDLGLTGVRELRFEAGISSYPKPINAQKTQVVFNAKNSRILVVDRQPAEALAARKPITVAPHASLTVGGIKSVAEAQAIRDHAQEWARKEGPKIIPHAVWWYTMDPNYRPADETDQWGWFAFNHHPDRDPKNIASVHHPLLGDFTSADPEYIRWLIRTSKAMGLNGFSIDYYAEKRPYEKQLPTLFRIAEQEGNFTLSLMYETRLAKNAEGKPDPELMKQHIRHILDTYATSPAFQRLGGVPVVYLFGMLSTGFYPWDYERVIRELEAEGYVFILIGDSTVHPAYYKVMNGLHEWINMGTFLRSQKATYWQLHPDQWEQNARSWLYKVMATHPNLFSVASIYGEFDDRELGGGDWGRGTVRRLKPTGGSTVEAGNVLKSTIDYAVNNADKLLWAKLMTWDDWNEGTEMEPSLEKGFSSFFAVMEFSARYRGYQTDPGAVLDLTEAYLKAKHGGRIPAEAQAVLDQARAYLPTVRANIRKGIQEYQARQTSQTQPQATPTPHRFRAVIGYVASAVTGTISLALMGLGAATLGMATQGGSLFILWPLLALVGGGYLAWGAVSFFRTGRAVEEAMGGVLLERYYESRAGPQAPAFSELTRDPLAFSGWLESLPGTVVNGIRQQARDEAIAWSDGRINEAAMAALKKNDPRAAAQVRWHESFRRELPGLLAMLPGVRSVLRREQVDSEIAPGSGKDSRNALRSLLSLNPWERRAAIRKAGETNDLEIALEIKKMRPQAGWHGGMLDDLFYWITREKAHITGSKLGITRKGGRTRNLMKHLHNLWPELNRRFPGQILKVRDEGASTGVVSSELFGKLEVFTEGKLDYTATDLVTKLFFIRNDKEGILAVFSDTTDTNDALLQIKYNGRIYYRSAADGKFHLPVQQPESRADELKAVFEEYRETGKILPGYRIEEVGAQDHQVEEMANADPRFHIQQHDIFTPIPEAQRGHLTILSNVLVPKYYTRADSIRALRQVGRNMLDKGLLLVVNEFNYRDFHKMLPTRDHYYTVFEKRGEQLVAIDWVNKENKLWAGGFRFETPEAMIRVIDLQEPFVAGQTDMAEEEQAAGAISSQEEAHPFRALSGYTAAVLSGLLSAALLGIGFATGSMLPAWNTWAALLPVAALFGGAYFTAGTVTFYRLSRGVQRAMREAALQRLYTAQAAPGSPTFAELRNAPRSYQAWIDSLPKQDLAAIRRQALTAAIAWSDGRVDARAMAILDRDQPEVANRIRFHETLRNDVVGYLALLPGFYRLFGLPRYMPEVLPLPAALVRETRDLSEGDRRILRTVFQHGAISTLVTLPLSRIRRAAAQSLIRSLGPVFLLTYTFIARHVVGLPRTEVFLDIYQFDAARRYGDKGLLDITTMHADFGTGKAPVNAELFYRTLNHRFRPEQQAKVILHIETLDRFIDDFAAREGLAGLEREAVLMRMAERAHANHLLLLFEPVRVRTANSQVDRLLADVERIRALRQAWKEAHPGQALPAAIVFDTWHWIIDGYPELQRRFHRVRTQEERDAIRLEVLHRLEQAFLSMEDMIAWVHFSNEDQQVRSWRYWLLYRSQLFGDRTLIPNLQWLRFINERRPDLLYRMTFELSPVYFVRSLFGFDRFIRRLARRAGDLVMMLSPEEAENQADPVPAPKPGVARPSSRDLRPETLADPADSELVRQLVSQGSISTTILYPLSRFPRLVTAALAALILPFFRTYVWFAQAFFGITRLEIYGDTLQLDRALAEYARGRLPMRSIHTQMHPYAMDSIRRLVQRPWTHLQPGRLVIHSSDLQRLLKYIQQHEELDSPDQAMQWLLSTADRNNVRLMIEAHNWYNFKFRLPYSLEEQMAFVRSWRERYQRDTGRAPPIFILFDPWHYIHEEHHDLYTAFAQAQTPDEVRAIRAQAFDAVADFFEQHIDMIDWLHLANTANLVWAPGQVRHGNAMFGNDTLLPLLDIVRYLRDRRPDLMDKTTLEFNPAYWVRSLYGFERQVRLTARRLEAERRGMDARPWVRALRLALSPDRTPAARAFIGRVLSVLYGWTRETVTDVGTVGQWARDFQSELEQQGFPNRALADIDFLGDLRTDRAWQVRFNDLTAKVFEVVKGFDGRQAFVAGLYNRDRQLVGHALFFAEAGREGSVQFRFSIHEAFRSRNLGTQALRMLATLIWQGQLFDRPVASIGYYTFADEGRIMVYALNFGVIRRLLMRSGFTNQLRLDLSKFASLVAPAPGLVRSRQLVLEPRPETDWASEMVLNPGIIQDRRTGRLHMLFRATGPYVQKQLPGKPAPFPIFLGYAYSDDQGLTWHADFSRPALAPRLEYAPEGILIENTAGQRVPNHANGTIEDPRLFYLQGKAYLIAACRMFPPGAYWAKEDPTQALPDWTQTPQNPYGRAAAGNVTVNVLFEVDLDALAAGNYERAFGYVGRLTDPALGENRDVVVFPEKMMINGEPQIVMLHRPETPGGTRRPSIFIRAARTWEELAVPESAATLLAEPRFPWERERIGASAPPLRISPTEWLLSYHGKQDAAAGYSQSFMILEEQPNGLPRVKHRCPEQLLIPLAEWEQPGKFRTPVLFVTGMARVGNELLLSYGAADEKAGVARLDYQALLDVVRQYDADGNRMGPGPGAPQGPAQGPGPGGDMNEHLRQMKEVLPEGVNRPIRGLQSLPGRLLDYGVRTVLFVTDGRGIGNLNLKLPMRSLAAVVLAGLALLQTVVAVFAGVRADATAVDDLSPRFEAIKRTLVLPDRITAREYNVKQIRFRPLSELGGFWQRLLRGQLLGAYQENGQAAEHGEWASIYVPNRLLLRMSEPMPAADGTLRSAMSRLGYRVEAMLFGAIVGYEAEQYYQAGRWDGVAETFGLTPSLIDAEAEAPGVVNLQRGVPASEWHQATRQKVGVTAMELTGLVDDYLREAAQVRNLGADKSLQALKEALGRELEQGAEPNLATVMRIASGLQGVSPGSLAGVLRELTREGQELSGEARQLVANGVVGRLITGEQVAAGRAGSRGVETAVAVAGQEVYVQSMPAANRAQLAAVREALSGLRGQSGVEGLISRLELAERVLTAISGVSPGRLGLLDEATGLALRGEVGQQARSEQAELLMIGEDLSRNVHGVKTGRVTTVEMEGVELANPQVFEVSAPVQQALEAADILKAELPENVVARVYGGEVEQMMPAPKARLGLMARLMRLMPSRRMQQMAMRLDPMGYWQSVVGGLGLSETAFGALLQRGDSPIVQAYLRYAARPESRKAERDLMKAMLRALKAEGEKAQTA